MRRFIILEDIQVLGLSSSASSIPNSIYIQRFIPTSRSLFSILSLSALSHSPSFSPLSALLPSLSPLFSLLSSASSISTLFSYLLSISPLFSPFSSLSSPLFPLFSFLSSLLSLPISPLLSPFSVLFYLTTLLSPLFCLWFSLSRYNVQTDDKGRETAEFSHFMNQSNEGGDEGGGRVENKEEEELEGRRVGMGERGEEACRGIE